MEFQENSIIFVPIGSGANFEGRKESHRIDVLEAIGSEKIGIPPRRKESTIPHVEVHLCVSAGPFEEIVEGKVGEFVGALESGTVKKHILCHGSTECVVGVGSHGRRKNSSERNQLWNLRLGGRVGWHLAYNL